MGMQGCLIWYRLINTCSCSWSGELLQQTPIYPNYIVKDIWLEIVLLDHERLQTACMYVHMNLEGGVPSDS